MVGHQTRVENRQIQLKEMEVIAVGMRSGIYFTYNGIPSEQFGILNVNVQSGLQSEPFASGRSIVEQKVRGNDKPYFMGVEKAPFEFNVSFAFEETWDDDRIRDVARWLLNPKYYAPLVFADEPDKIYYCLCVDSPELVHTCLKTGYVNLRFRCADSYAYTSVYNVIHDLSANPVNGTVITFENFGDAECRPLVEIRKIGDGDVSFFNQSNGNAEMTFQDLLDDEILTVDCENRVIETNVPLTYRYENLHGDYLKLVLHNNYLLVKGTCEIKFTYQLKRLQ